MLTQKGKKKKIQIQSPTRYIRHHTTPETPKPAKRLQCIQSRPSLRHTTHQDKCVRQDHRQKVNPWPPPALNPEEIGERENKRLAEKGKKVEYSQITAFRLD